MKEYKMNRLIKMILGSVSLLLIISCSDSGCGDCICDGGNDSTPPSETMRPFVTIWKTDNTGVTGSHQILISTKDSIGDFTVNWGDGVIEEGLTGDVTHIYGMAGTYAVQISGDFPRIYFNYGGTDNRKLLSVEQWGDIKWHTMEEAFQVCPNLVINARDTPDLSLVTDMSSMFSGATSLNQPLNDWNVSNVTNMESMFVDAISFNQPLDRWNVSNVVRMDWMFEHASSFNQPLNSWDVSNVTNMASMFELASSFNQPLSDWNTTSVTNMNDMFRYATEFDQPLNSWDVSNVISMRGMFQFASSFNQPLSDWNTSNVTNMGDMFRYATVFNQPLNSWDVSNVTQMYGMFENTVAFDQPLGEWDVSKVVYMGEIFSDSTLSTANYDDLLIGWSALNVESNVTFDGGNSRYSAGAATTARNTLTTTYGWIITDGGQEP